MKGEKKASLCRRPTDTTPFSSSSPGCQKAGCHQQPPGPPSSCGQPTSHLPTLGTPTKCLQDIQVVPGQAGWGLGQPDPVGGVPAHGRGWHGVGFRVPSSPNLPEVLRSRKNCCTNFCEPPHRPASTGSSCKHEIDKGNAAMMNFYVFFFNVLAAGFPSALSPCKQ